MIQKKSPAPADRFQPCRSSLFFYLDSTERKFKFQFFVYREQKFFVCSRTPAVIPGNTHLCLCHTDDRVMYRWKFIRVFRVLHLMRCVWQRTEAHIVSGKKHSSSLFVCHFRVTDTGLVATFLRNQIFCKVILYFIAVNAKLCPLGTCLLYTSPSPRDS